MVLDFQNMFRNISNRERMLIYCAAALLILFAIYQVLFVPVLNSRRELELERELLESRFNKLKNLAAQYQEQQEAYENVKRMLGRKKSLSVLTYLEDISEAVGIRDNIEYIRPKGNETQDGVTREIVEIKIDAIPMQSLLRFLYEIENKRQGLIVSYLRLKPFFKEKGKADVVLSITDITIE
jgi:type II secretory pathway component PulM